MRRGIRQFGGVIVLAALLAGCSTRFAEQPPPPPLPPPPSSTPSPSEQRMFAPLPPTDEVWLPSSEAEVVAKPSARQKVLDKLYPFQEEWHHTPYRYGGAGPHGIDCSAFVQRAYRDLFGITLPRTTRQQAACGTAVAEPEVRAGDLVFFRMSGQIRHVGIYLEGGRFMHVSTKYGVMISSMDKPYWKRHYWTTRRVR